MKRKYVAPASEFVRFDVEDVLTNRLPIKDYANGDTEADGTSTDIGVGGGIGGNPFGK